MHVMHFLHSFSFKVAELLVFFLEADHQPPFHIHNLNSQHNLIILRLSASDNWGFGCGFFGLCFVYTLCQLPSITTNHKDIILKKHSKPLHFILCP